MDDASTQPAELTTLERVEGFGARAALSFLEATGIGFTLGTTGVSDAVTVASAEMEVAVHSPLAFILALVKTIMPHLTDAEAIGVALIVLALLLFGTYLAVRHAL